MYIRRRPEVSEVVNYTVSREKKPVVIILGCRDTDAVVALFMSDPACEPGFC
jgi:hypothetical protein